MDNDIKTFLYNSINDIQNTIKSLDTKVGFIFVVLSIPFSNVDKIYNTCESIIIDQNNGPLFYIKVAIVILFLTAWLLAFVSTIRTIISIENPSAHIVNSSELSGSFYAGNLFNVGVQDSLINRESIKANKDVRTHCQSLPSTNESIINELVFEQIKLAYIRDIKSIRQRWAYRFTTIWLSSGLAIYIISKLSA